MGTVEHPRIRPGILDSRRYQETIAAAAIERHTLVVLPTGLGKTAIALRVIAEHLRRHPTRSVLFLAPTRPLVVQHAKSVSDTLLAPTPLVLTGTISPERRQALLKPPQVIVATPQVIGNDLAHHEFPLESLSLLVVDEAHRAVGDYPYVAIGRANSEGPRARVLAMTASPGSRKERIRAVWANLGIEHVEYRTTDAPDVLPYVHGIGVESIEVTVPAEVQHLATLVRTAVARQVDPLVSAHLLPAGSSGKRDLLTLGERLHREVAASKRSSDGARPGLWAAVTAQAAAMKGLHALELVETQGVESFRAYLERQAELRPSPAQRAFLHDPDIVEARQRLRGLSLEHPKIEKAVELATDQIARAPDSRVIVFTQYRQTAERLVEELGRRAGVSVRAARFVGQASHGEDLGMSQKDQGEILDRFRDGRINVLVATSVAEEGLDVPSTDLVVFYEPVPDVIRSIQRRGRTGRAREGRVVVLVAGATRDVGLFRSAKGKERRMHEMLEEVEAESRSGSVRPPRPDLVQRSLLEEYPAPGRSD
ncbi:MAG TPA: helicase-related protein [Thermoplasmata archaeon]|nr:helicase-related protein [Thermoplasmata archaeon]